MLASAAAVTAAASLLAGVAAQPFQPDSGIAPLGSLRTSDYDGPYNITMLSAQVRMPCFECSEFVFKYSDSVSDIL